MEVMSFQGEPDKEGDAVPMVIPQVSPACYEALFRVADWWVTKRPWETRGERLALQQRDSSGKSWRVSFETLPNLVVLRLTRVVTQGEKEDRDRLELRLQSSEFLQGHDYELNVRYAPEHWDGEDLDVLVMRAFDSFGSPVFPEEEEVALLGEALGRLRNHWS